VIKRIINNTTTAIGTIKPIQSLALPLGEFFTILLAEGKMKKNIAIRRIADPIFNQSIKLPSKK
jgi:hypothetical protein